MNAAELNQLQIQPGHPPNARSVIEASVHLPKRGSRWIASFRDETGRQRWRSTGLVDRRAALVVAQEWEKAARQRRADQDELSNGPVIRGRRGRAEGGTGLTQKEVALFMGMTERGVRAVERRALQKLRCHPALRSIWREWSKGEIGEGAASAEDVELTDAEIAAVYGLARTRAEHRAVDKIMALTAS